MNFPNDGSSSAFELRFTQDCNNEDEEFAYSKWISWLAFGITAASIGWSIVNINFIHRVIKTARRDWRYSFFRQKNGEKK